MIEAAETFVDVYPKAEGFADPRPVGPARRYILIHGDIELVYQLQKWACL